MVVSLAIYCGVSWLCLVVVDSCRTVVGVVCGMAVSITKQNSKDSHYLVRGLPHNLVREPLLRVLMLVFVANIVSGLSVSFGYVDGFGSSVYRSGTTVFMVVAISVVLYFVHAVGFGRT